MGTPNSIPMRKLFYGLVALFAVLATLTACHSSSSRLSKREFCQLYYDSMSRRFPQVKFAVVDERTISASWNGKGARMFIDNAYASYEMSPDSLVPILQRYANSAGDVYNMDMSVQTENVVPVIRAISELQEMKVLATAAGAKKQAGMLHEAYNDELVICYAVDTKNNIRYLQDKDLETIKLPKDSLLPVAIKNLEGRLSIRTEDLNGVYMFVAGGNYEASIILMQDRWTREQLPVDGDFVIAIPSRDVLLVTGSRNKEGIKKIKEFAKKTYGQGSYSVSENLFKWDGKRFSKFEG